MTLEQITLLQQALNIVFGKRRFGVDYDLHNEPHNISVVVLKNGVVPQYVDDVCIQQFTPDCYHVYTAKLALIDTGSWELVMDTIAKHIAGRLVLLARLGRIYSQ